MAKSKPVACACANGRKCDNTHCWRVAVTATREANLPPDSPGRRAADELVRRHRR